jgi:hypothetical protein
MSASNQKTRHKDKRCTYSGQVPGDGIGSQAKGGSKAKNNVELHGESVVEIRSNNESG